MQFINNHPQGDVTIPELGMTVIPAGAVFTATGDLARRLLKVDGLDRVDKVSGDEPVDEGVTDHG